ncbi:putative NADPH-ferredoxin reductase FprA [Corynebacterium sp. CMW7794]|uniref:ferredoxin--NADP(+) reductase n=1 Tax=Corynebacterium phoceense TaxID=1686286 RepID=A0A540R8Y2_9CORY|nr:MULTISPECIES: FAD-dependent oxidoreductase [Corynebacterium]KXB56574.1 putative NADPH-ferredoxin reductase FprA [Corynebacterium sp. DNF00584]KXI17474.1 putative NADPH-ferredoxin reductase FprA [Corynebacterium sp. CMW7794]MBF9011749.1 FAD-dependent oxidoreductase [Corynebacterium phoceense]MCQ9332148.1 FAD-dependent oxidoreductase [Corynebacterium phoceense]MCQ9341546.1 FAD-dependent oxidoreductase [Corynebacterium phoceense]
MTSPLRVAVIGAGPAGIYASDILVKKLSGNVQIDLIEQMPAPFGLIRYGVAPDHPRIKGIIKSLHRVMETEQIRLLTNIHVGRDVTVEELQDYYDAIVFATGAVGDRHLNIPGVDLEGVHGAGEFVGFYDGNPRFKRDWDLSATEVAVVGVGNVGLDVARILAKTGDELHVTEIADNVYESLKKNKAETVRVFGRRGPAQAKFTPQELKELDHSPTINVVVDPEDIDYDEASLEARSNSKSQDLVCQVLEQYAIREPKEAPHTLQIHLFEQPVEILGENGKVTGIKTERTALNGDGSVSGTGKFTEWPVQAVYLAVGYRSDPIESVPFNDDRHVINNDGGHVTSLDGEVVPGLYATGWVKRGPVGLIGNTKSDATETIGMLVADYEAGKLSHSHGEDFTELLKDKSVDYLTWDGWKNLDAAERAAGEAEGRERKKFVEWEDMVSQSHNYQI